MIRWLFSTVSIAMVIDDHDMHDDWNISRVGRGHASRAVVAGAGGKRAGLVLDLPVHRQPSPGELEESELQEVRELDDAGPVLREFAAKDDSEREGKRWSYYRDLGSTR